MEIHAGHFDFSGVTVLKKAELVRFTKEELEENNEKSSLISIRGLGL